MNLTLLLNKYKNIKYRYTCNKSEKRIKKLHKIHIGKRGFVICNGPSLNIKDLDLLKNEITIGTNKIFLAFNDTSWRPTYYTIISSLLISKVEKEIKKYFKEIYIARYTLNNINYSFFNPYYFWKSLGEVEDDDKIRFSDNLSDGVFSGRMVTYEALQFAVHLGLNPIYLIGCDHNYYNTIEKRDLNIEIPVNYTKDHFHPEYRKKGEIINPAMIEVMDLAYKNAKKFSEKNNIEIFNATRGGYLEVFDRVNFDSLF